MDNNPQKYDDDPEVLIHRWIQNNSDIFYNVSQRTKRTRQNTMKDKPSLWESNWGTLIMIMGIHFLFF